jgi:hypothetical protein
MLTISDYDKFEVSYMEMLEQFFMEQMVSSQI